MVLAVESAVGGGAAHAATWKKIDPITCEPEVFDASDPCTACGYFSTPPDYGRFPELTIMGPSTGNITRHFYCQVPDDTDIPVAYITSYLIDGYSKPGLASAARGCIQFTNGTGESCTTFYPFTESWFTGWSMPIPAQWQEWWHNAYVELRLTGNGGELEGTAVYRMFAWRQ